MSSACHSLRSALWALVWLSLTLPLWGQTCLTSSDLDDAPRSAITSAGQRYFAMAAKGDTASLQQNAIPSLASDFSAISTTVKDHQAELAGAQPNLKALFSLDATGSAPLPNAEFYCGVFGKNGQTPGSAIFELNNLPPGKYAVVIFSAVSPKTTDHFSAILQQAGTEWELGGLYIKPAQLGGHDGEWFLARAREYKTKGETHNAWFYYLEARSLISPLPFMSTMITDQMYDEFQKVRPSDIPADGKTTDLAAGTATYKLTALFPDPVGDDLDLVVKYQSADASNTSQAYQNNVALIKALVAKYPEVRNAFAAVVARAVDPSNRDYGTLLAMKDIK
jgi:hypothetical protein